MPNSEFVNQETFQNLGKFEIEEKNNILENIGKNLHNPSPALGDRMKSKLILKNICLKRNGHQSFLRNRS